MELQEALQKIKEWFDSGKAYATIRIYREYGDSCCNCTKPRLPPTKFEENMTKMEVAVKAALEGTEGAGLEEVDRRNIRIVFDMLQQMFSSVEIAKDAEDEYGFNVHATLESARSLAYELNDFVASLASHDGSNSSRSRRSARK